MPNTQPPLRMNGYCKLAVLCLSLSLSAVLPARQFRAIKPIAAAGTPATAAPQGAVRVARAQPVERTEVDRLVRDALAKWNTPAMAETLAADFYDGTRLLDTMSAAVPRDAKLRVQSVQDIQTLEQYRIPNPANPARSDMLSVVSATVRTQIEFNDPVNGFIRRSGVSEFILKITTPVAP